MSARYELTCECGWHRSYWLGGDTFLRDAYSDLERELASEQHPEVRRMWEALLNSPQLQLEKQRPDRSKPYVPAFLHGRRGLQASSKPYVYSGWELGVCRECAQVERYLHIVTAQTPEQEKLHPSLCRACANEVTVVSVNDVHCPACSRPAASRRKAIE
ncbi:hypothetical protein ACFQI7_25790 [Paenibacillus allorhizosphaerae]|uniref:Zinc ribbon domain-containing protein n=1 Tax=Paenibacillus allorhizosphaerae TaxID=2849866 RepID=A0ABN7TLE7_9BACL|nr:hypothetical protein [Paenibacillus allorhizosphaerae]CAG7645511.1 hypothetical protein PAECIP111802_03534 [Paenibacillus allorhizosphaerae]